MSSSASALSVSRPAFGPPVALGLALSLGIYLLGAGYFGSVQAIWVDESTQMSGLALPLDTQLAWMLRQADVSMGVPLARMPPLSYWAGTGWSWVFGLSETSMRWFGIIMVLACAPAIFMTGRMAGGLAGGLFATAFIFASPSMMVHAVEIRPYPLFFCLSTWAVWSYVCLTTPKTERATTWHLWALLVRFLSGASYAHFYGLPLAACLLFSLFVHHLWIRRSLWPVVLATLAFAGAWSGVLPFVLSSLGDGTRGGEAAAPAFDATNLIYGLGRLGFRHLFHPVLLASPVALALGLLGVLGLTVLTVLWRAPAPAARDPAAERFVPIAFVAMPLGLGFLGLSALQVLLFVTNRGEIDALVPHYNLWQLPLVICFLACALRPRAVRALALACAGGTIAAKVLGAVLLLQNPVLYTHGAGEWLADAIEDPARTLVIHVADGAWGSLFFPVNYLTQQQTTQWLRQQDGQVGQLAPGVMLPIADPATAQLAFDRVIEIQARNFTSRDLSHLVTGARECSFPTTLSEIPGTTRETYCSYVSAVRRITDNAP